MPITGENSGLTSEDPKTGSKQVSGELFLRVEAKVKASVRLFREKMGPS